MWLQAPPLPEPGQGLDRGDATDRVRGLLHLVHVAVAERRLDNAWQHLTEAGDRYAHLPAGSAYPGPRPSSRVEWQPPEPIAKGEEAPEDFASRKSRSRVHRI